VGAAVDEHGVVASEVLVRIEVAPDPPDHGGVIENVPEAEEQSRRPASAPGVIQHRLELSEGPNRHVVDQDGVRLELTVGLQDHLRSELDHPFGLEGEARGGPTSGVRLHDGREL
jgi:hypothetical protein